MVKCSDYRLEMILLGLRRRLNEETLTADEKKKTHGGNPEG
jgi:hypothetical protein